MLDRAVRARTRRVLALLMIVCSFVVGVLGINGRLGLGPATLLALSGLGVASILPAGGRAAGALMAIWTGVGIAAVGRALAAGSSGGPERLRLALLGAIVFLLASGIGLWACVTSDD